MKKTFICGLFLLLLAIIGFTPAARADTSAFDKTELTIQPVEQGSPQKFSVEVAKTQAQQEYGLMFRRDLAADAGMIFPYNPPQRVYMWMKNTYIPLDMLFVRPNGSIGKIISEAKPLDLTPLGSAEPIIAVIELKAGEAGRRGFKIGDKVSCSALVVSH